MKRRSIALILALLLLPLWALAEAPAESPLIAGKTPLYYAEIEPFSGGKSVRMRAEPASDADPVCSVYKGETVTVYEVLPSYVLAEWKGNVGYIIRTCVEEHVTPIDPASTPPYNVVPAQFVATLTQLSPIHTAPDPNSAIFPIQPGPGSRIAVLEFVDGYAKVLYWRSYGYIDAHNLTDLVVVASGEEPLSPDTPLAAYSSFYAYNTGEEGNDGRCKNIVRSCELMTRTLQPGEELNYNRDIGPYKRDNGYFAAPVFINGGVQLGYGGGTCQSSGTLYSAIMQIPGITILQRRPHGPGCAEYLPMHQDVAVGTSTINFRFRNDCDYPLRIVAETTGEGTISIQIFKGEVS